MYKPQNSRILIFFATKILMEIGLLVSAKKKKHFYNFNFKIRLDRYYMWSIIYIETFHVYGVFSKRAKNRLKVVKYHR